MNNLITTLSLFAVLSLPAMAADGNPSIFVKSNLYEKDGPTNSFTMVLGAAPGCAGYIDVVSDNGNQTEAEIDVAYYDSQSAALVGTNISCQVGPQGWIKVYCDPGVAIDYLSISGAEVTEIVFENPQDIEILALEHNALEALDLSEFCNLSTLSLKDNPFDKSPLIVGPNKPHLQLLDLSIIDNIDPDFDLGHYPSLLSFDAMSTKTMTHATPANCPRLQRLSIDNTSVAELDVTKNPDLYILNISETRITEIDLSNCKRLQQFYATHSSWFNSGYKLSSLDLSHNPDLIYLFVNDNNLQELDVSANTHLRDLYARNNRLSAMDLTNNLSLNNVALTGNYMDFNTLPLVQDTWISYEFDQKPLPMPRSVLVDTPYDFAPQVVVTRDDAPFQSETFAMVYRIDPNNPMDPIALDDEDYTFEQGLLTMHSVPADSVFAVFYNDLFPETPLKSSNFKVKSAEEYGKNELAATLGNILSPGDKVQLYVGMDGASADSPRKFYVDFGDGKQIEYLAYSWQTPESPNVKGVMGGSGNINIYVPECEVVTSLKVEDMYLIGFDPIRMPELRQLSLINTELYSIDLSWNRCLQQLVLTGNHFGSSLSLAGYNGYYEKNVLSTIVLANNEMTDVKMLSEPYSIRHLDLSHNNLTELNFKDYDNLQSLNVSYNQLSELVINYCAELKYCDCSHNNISNLRLPETNVIEQMDLSHNKFTFANLPAEWPSLADYVYYPQSWIDVPQQAPNIDLSAQIVDVEGNPTTWVWREENGSILTQGTDYTYTDGVTNFLEPAYGRRVYCELQNAAFPLLSGANALRTTLVEPTAMPTNLVGSFVTKLNGQSVALVMLSSINDDAIYIDWGDGEPMTQYSMQYASQAYRFSHASTAGATVKMYSYDASPAVYFLGISNATLQDIDLAAFDNVYALRLSGDDINENTAINWPNPEGLAELDLANDSFSSFDVSMFPNLQYLYLDGNKLEEIDLTPAQGLQSVALAKNRLTAVSLDNPQLYSLELSSNRLTEIDLSKVPSIYQLMLNQNQLTSLDYDVLNSLSQMCVLWVDQNKFDFTTLPIPQEQWTYYLYGNQATLSVTPTDGMVDLSSQASRDGYDTVYSWYYNYPEKDEETGELIGDLLIAGEDYTIEQGVTQFLKSFDKVCCVLTNPLFPNAYLQTNLISVTTSGIANLGAQSQPTRYYNLQGMPIEADRLTPGIYIKTSGAATQTIIIK